MPLDLVYFLSARPVVGGLTYKSAVGEHATN